MKYAVVPVLSPADIPFLPALAEFLKEQKIERLYILANPHIGLKTNDQISAVDAEIQNFKNLAANAAGKHDPQAFANYVGQMEKKQLERDTILREFWKKVPKEELERTMDEVLKPLLNKAVCPAIKYNALADVTDPENLYDLLNKMRGSWPKELPHGQYSLVSPQSITGGSVVKECRPMKVETAPANTPEAREKELYLSRFMGIKAVARKHGITTEGRDTKEIVAEIIAKEFPAAVAA